MSTSCTVLLGLARTPTGIFTLPTVMADKWLNEMTQNVLSNKVTLYTYSHGMTQHCFSQWSPKETEGKRVYFISSIPSVCGIHYSPLKSLSYARGIWMKIVTCKHLLTHTGRWERLSDPLRQSMQTMTANDLPVSMTTRGFIFVLCYAVSWSELWLQSTLKFRSYMMSCAPWA